MLRALAFGLTWTALVAAAEPAASPSPSPAPAAQEPAAPAPTAPAPIVAASGQLRGTVTYGRNEPASGAIVIVRPEASPSPVRAATTGTAGSFAFDGLADGTYRTEVRREGYATVVKSGIKVRAPFRAVVEVILAKGDSTPVAAAPVAGAASLVGAIRTPNGAKLSEAKVRLTRVDGPDDSRLVLTEASGAFDFRELAAGRWRLEIQGAGLLPLRAELDLAGDVVLDAQLAAQPADYRPLPQDLIVPEDVIPPPNP